MGVAHDVGEIYDPEFEFRNAIFVHHIGERPAKLSTRQNIRNALDWTDHLQQVLQAFAFARSQLRC